MREVRSLVLEPLRQSPTDLSALRRAPAGGGRRRYSRGGSASDRHVGSRHCVRDRLSLDDRRRRLGVRAIGRSGARLGRRLRTSHLGKRLVAPCYRDVRALRAAPPCLEHVVLGDPRADRGARVWARLVSTPISPQRNRREHDEPAGPPVDRRGRRVGGNIRSRRSAGRRGDVAP